MDAPPLPSGVPELLEATRASRGPVVVLTGAGISAESGIPTFRGKEGYWVQGSQNYHPQELATFSAFSRQPDTVWAWYLYRRGVCRGAEPNDAHQALVDLQGAYADRFTLVTQNVDGLHLRAGSDPARTYQIHGNVDFMRCARECSTDTYPIPEEIGPKEKGGVLEDRERDLLVCPACGSKTRPHVLWFDEFYNEHFFRFESSLDVAQSARLLIVVGTAGQTNLPNQVVGLAVANGARVIDINIDRNPFAQLAVSAGGHWLEGPATRWLPAVVRELT